jgi:hypothetical protein
MQRYGIPKTLLHDNAAEFCGGTFEQFNKQEVRHMKSLPQ